ncbi:helix-turn-helix domain-containing protein [Arabiibacter massiliensis]|uniref:helix-turn-helix domain-containing protein n=1 Tax=Arabiibacter massiliensis TaxID=1870985 RepID=UPI0009BC14A0|nr:helix-turn-helix transcriptional regulator [Arabiibacter massiliensis]
MGMREQPATSVRGKAGLAALPRLVRENPASLYLPIALTATWQYAMVKIWNHFCTTPAACLYLSEGAVCLVLAALLAAFGRRLSGRSVPKPLTWALAALFCLVPLGVVAIGPFPGTDLVMGAVGSLSMAWCYLRCGKLYIGLGFQRAIVCVVVSLVIAYLARIALFLLPDAAVYPLVCCVPLAFEPAIHKARAARTRAIERDGGPAERDAQRTSASFLVALALEVTAFCVVAGFFGTPLLVGYSWLHCLILIGIVSTLLVVLLERGPEVRLSQLFELVLLCCLFVFVVLSFTSHASAAALLIINVPHALVTALLWMLLVDLENRREFPPLTVFMAGWGLSNLAVGTGQLVSASVISAGDLPSNFMIVLAFFLVASVVFVFNKFTAYDAFSSFAREGERGKARIDYSQVDERCLALGERHGLTPREVEVVQLIAKGRSRGYIASSLVISENTVKGHARNAYGKLGIHGKQELLTLIESL